MKRDMTLGATPVGAGRTRFLVWAPFAQQVEVHLLTPTEAFLPLEPLSHGYHQAVIEDVEVGSLYFYRLDGQDERPDPASRSQPQDIHGPSQVVEATFPWQDMAWHGVPWQDYIIYELHIGTFSAAGTFEAAMPYLQTLKDLGITAIELMPIAQFPGARNWGYDGVYSYAAQHAYGGPRGLKTFVNACHSMGLAVILDVVYNHLGPEGNYLGSFGPYFTDRYKTPWGAALNFDGPHSDEVRRFFIENALYWITDCHIDALRLDAVHAIVDHSAYPFLEELAVAVHEQAEHLQRRVYVIAESDLDDTRIIRPRAWGGYAHDAQWSDSFHHALHTLLTGERRGYYEDFGQVSHLAKAFTDGYVYSGQYSGFRQRRHGNSSRCRPAHQFVVCAQNHDQVGNRILGERLSQLVSFEKLKLTAAVVLLSPFIPLLFMGEEYGETAPFPYFISHSDPTLVEAVRQGRREEFAAFHSQSDFLDPQDEATFHSAKLNHRLRQHTPHAILQSLYKELIHLRRTQPPLARLDKDCLEVHTYETAQVLFLRRWYEADDVVLLFHFGTSSTTLTLPVPAGQWQKRLDTAAEQWHGPGSTLPNLLMVDGEASLTLPGQAGVLFIHSDLMRGRH